MKTINILMVTTLTMIIASGCSHLHKVQGIETQSEVPEGIRVSIGSSEVKEGEKVDVLRPACRQVTGGKAGTRNVCHSEKVGEALILRVLDHDSAVVKPDNGLTMDSKMTVEKKHSKE